MLAAVLLVAIVAGAATAGKSQKPKIKPAANGTARASAFALAKQIRALQATERQLEKQLAKAAAKSPQKPPRTITQKATLASAADGNYLFAATAEVTGVLHGDDYRIDEIRGRVTRTDRVAGGTTVIFDRKDTYVLALAARAGSVAFQDAKYKIQKNKKISVVATVYKGATTDAKLAPIDSGKFTLSEWADPICGEGPLLATLSDKGEAAIAHVKAACSDKSFDFAAELELWRGDGSRTNLGPLSLGGASTSIVLTGDRLLQTSPFERAAAIRNISDNKLTNLWNPGTQTADIGPDGTVAMIGTSTEEQFIYDFEEYEYESESVAKSASDIPEPGSYPPMPMPERNPKFRMPFVIFPQGDAENPVLVAASSARINALKFCGPNLYALESKAKQDTEEAYYGDDVITGLGSFTQTAQAPFDVQMLDNRGAFIRSLGKTKPISVVGVGCNGDRLVIIADQGDGVRAVELGP